MNGVLAGLAPLVAADARVLILGSFPGAASLKARQYYGHPQNQFWRILQAIWPASPIDICAGSYEKRSEWLLDKRLGLWDVYASCEREGSLDIHIRNPIRNDLAGLIQRCPDLGAIAHNGAESFRHSKLTASFGLPVYKLPSTSPANAAWTFESKLAVWRELLDEQGLI